MAFVRILDVARVNVPTRGVAYQPPIHRPATAIRPGGGPSSSTYPKGDIHQTRSAMGVEKAGIGGKGGGGYKRQIGIGCAFFDESLLGPFSQLQNNAIAGDIGPGRKWTSHEQGTRLGDEEPEEPRLTSSPVPIVKDPSPPPPPPPLQVVDEPAPTRRPGRRARPGGSPPAVPAAHPP